MNDDVSTQQAGGDIRKPGPPGRPPPPHAVTASPAHAHQSKSAFDDLNDTIQLAMGNSPAKQQQQQQQPVHTVGIAGAGNVGAGNVPGGIQQQQLYMQQAMPAAAGYAIVQQPQQQMFASPSRQPIGLLILIPQFIQYLF